MLNLKWLNVNDSKMKLRLIFFISSFAVSFIAECQNLVPNGSFEDANICEFNEKCSPSAWFIVPKMPSAGYFQDGTPAFDGSRWLNLITGCKLKNYREYLQTMLLHKLEKGKSYTISFYLHGWDMDPNLNDIGFYFTDSFPYLPLGDTLIQPDEYVSFLDAKATEKKNRWFKITKQYIPQKDYSCLVIGNFSHKDYREIAKQRSLKSIFLSVRIDDIDISANDKAKCLTCQQAKDSLYAMTLRHSSKVDTSTVQQEPVSRESTPIETVDTLELDKIYFKSGSSLITNPSILDSFSNQFKQSGIKRLKVIGYTDNVGTAAANQLLSIHRAEEVANAISSKFGISKSIIEFEGRGITTNNREHHKNRRVEVYIYLTR